MPYLIKKNKSISDCPYQRIADEDIIVNVRCAVEKTGEKLTNMQGLFYLSLVDYALNHGTFKGDGFILILTEDDMTKMFGYKKSFVNNALRVFKKAGLIDRLKLSTASKVNLFADSRYNIKTTKMYSSYFLN